MEASMVKCAKCSRKTPLGLSCENGHDICGSCVFCPVCPGRLVVPSSSRLPEFESKMEKLSIDPKIFVEPKKRYKRRGDLLKTVTTYECEGNAFSGWKCKWTGTEEEMYGHFSHSHKDNFFYLHQPILQKKINTSRSSNIVYIIGLVIKEREVFFWLKQRVDLEKQLVYLMIQYIGPKEAAKKYFYEFTATNDYSDILKIRETCISNKEDTNAMFEAGKCIIIPLDALEAYADEKELTLILKIEETALEQKDSTFYEKIWPSQEGLKMRNYGLNIKKVLIFPNITENLLSFQCIVNMLYNTNQDYCAYCLFFYKIDGIDEQFLFKCKNDYKSKRAYFYVQYLGNNDPSKYFYELIMPLDALRTFQVARHCHGISVVTELDESKFVMIPFELMQAFLMYKVEIYFALKINEKENVGDPIRTDVVFSSYLNIVEEAVELLLKEVEFTETCEVALNDLNFTQQSLEENAENCARLARECTKLYNPIFYKLCNEEVEETVCVDITIYFKATINYSKSSAHEKTFAVCKSDGETRKLENFVVRYFFNVAYQMMVWIVQLLSEKEPSDHYEYEFGVFGSPSQFVKVRKACYSTAADERRLIYDGDCVMLPFETVNRYTNSNNEFFCTIRILEDSALTRLDCLDLAMDNDEKEDDERGVEQTEEDLQEEDETQQQD